MGLVRLDSDGHGGWQAGTPKPAYDAVRDLIRGNPPRPIATGVQREPLTEDRASPSFIPIHRTCDLSGYANLREDNIRNRAAYAYCRVLARDADNIGGIPIPVNSRMAEVCKNCCFPCSARRNSANIILSPEARHSSFRSSILCYSIARLTKPSRTTSRGLSAARLELVIIGSHEFRSSSQRHSCRSCYFRH